MKDESWPPSVEVPSGKWAFEILNVELGRFEFKCGDEEVIFDASLPDPDAFDRRIPAFPFSQGGDRISPGSLWNVHEVDLLK